MLVPYITIGRSDLGLSIDGASITAPSSTPISSELMPLYKER